jgi:hypothetical protein
LVGLSLRGRRRLLIASALGCALAHLWIAAGFRLDEEGHDVGRLLCALGLFAYVAAFSLGIGPVCWLLCSEIFPLEVRAGGMMIACTLNRIASCAVSFWFLSAVDAFGGPAVFTGFAAVCVTFAFFVVQYVPETRGLSLEAIRGLFEDSTSTNVSRAWSLRSSAGFEVARSDSFEDDGGSLEMADWGARESKRPTSSSGRAVPVAEAQEMGEAAAKPTPRQAEPTSEDL